MHYADAPGEWGEDVPAASADAERAGEGSDGATDEDEEGEEGDGDDDDLTASRMSDDGNGRRQRRGGGGGGGGWMAGVAGAGADLTLEIPLVACAMDEARAAQGGPELRAGCLISKVMGPHRLPIPPPHTHKPCS